MIVEFRVLAIPKETGHYDTDYLRGVFGADGPILDTVDHLPPQAAISIIMKAGWTSCVQSPIPTGDYIMVPFIK